jgi:multicomponent Na+:H+ antiporter subunit E
VPFFICRSFVGGIDVARRALQRSLPLYPTLLEYPWHLPPGPVRIFFANTTNLLPGTLSAELHDDRLVLHVLDMHQPIAEELHALESRVAALFGLHLSSADSREGLNDA